MKARQDTWADSLRDVYGHVIDQAIKAPAGPLTGAVGRDEYGDEVITLAGDGDRTIDITFPSLEKTPIDTLIKAIVEADGTDKVPAEVIARLLLLALGVDDVDDVLADYLDDDGHWIDPDDSAGDRTVKRFRDGEDPTEDL